MEATLSSSRPQRPRSPGPQKSCRRHADALLRQLRHMLTISQKTKLGLTAAWTHRNSRRFNLLQKTRLRALACPPESPLRFAHASHLASAASARPATYALVCPAELARRLAHASHLASAASARPATYALVCPAELARRPSAASARPATYVVPRVGFEPTRPFTDSGF